MDAPGTKKNDRGAGPSPMGVGSILTWAGWLGVGSGLVELAVFLLKCRVFDPRNANVSRHLTWMFPAAGLLVVGLIGLGLAVSSRWIPRLGAPRFVRFVLLDVAIVGVLFRAPIFTAVCLLLATGLAWRGSALLAGWPTARVKFAGFAPLGLLGLLAGASFGVEEWKERSGSGTSSPGEAGRNVILVVLDTVRADRLSAYGYHRDTTPNLARLATRGVRFDRAFSTAPWTAPSHASLFTGRWPHELTIGWDRPLDATFPTLAESLAEAGYATAGFVANTTYCSYETGLDRGFEHYEDYDVTLRGVLLCSSLVERALAFAHKHPTWVNALGLGGPSKGDRKDAARINRDFLGWLDGHAGRDRPFFAFLNY
jgi:hypothetical protein